VKNKDFYIDKIIKAALEHDTLGVDARTKEMKPCREFFDNLCQDCLFYKERVEMRDTPCTEAYKAWLEEEYEEPYKELSLTERGFIKIMNKGYIIKLKNGTLHYSELEPFYVRGADKWGQNYCDFIRINDNFFNFIKPDECWEFNNGYINNITDKIKYI
jgi:hypothetical protein